jgi:hypothetical protein
MTSATTQPASGQHAERRGYGLVLFASVMLVIIGCFNLIYGIAAIANSHVFTANAHHVFAGLRTWGWITLIIGVLQLLAAAGVLAGSQLARWFAVAVLGVNAIDMMFFLPAYPFWALVILAADVVALYGLCAYGSRANWKPPTPKVEWSCVTSGPASRCGPSSEGTNSASCIGRLSHSTSAGSAAGKAARPRPPRSSSWATGLSGLSCSHTLPARTRTSSRSAPA